MKISCSWLQSYFNDPLPPSDEIARLLIMHSFEVEKINRVQDDSILDIDVLPNRAHDCLSHLGVATELGALLDKPLTKNPLNKLPDLPAAGRLLIKIEDPDCLRYSAALIFGVKVCESPEWLSKRLNSIGQKSTNNVVDIVNYVMFDIGQPLHAFDFEKLNTGEGTAAIKIRQARVGEKITTLDGEKRDIAEGAMLITEGVSDNPIAIAGIKGGEASAIDESTQYIVLESANFAANRIRRASRSLNIRTEASLRFEHQISPELTTYALGEAVSLLKTHAADENFEVIELADMYPQQQEKKFIMVSNEKLSSLLGVAVEEKKINETLKKLGIKSQTARNEIEVEAPFIRLDLNSEEDIIEEVGRLYGYEKIEPQPLSEKKSDPKINKEQAYCAKIRKALSTLDFSEVMTYAFENKGALEVQNPLSGDKKYLRAALADGLRSALELNVKYADLLGISQVCIFEIGKIFKEEGEILTLGIAVKAAGQSKKTSSEKTIEKAVKEIEAALNTKLKIATENRSGEVVEINLNQIFETLESPAKYEWATSETTNHVAYKKISPYPYILRDIALWTPQEVKPEEIQKIISEKGGELVVKSNLFDIYHKKNDGEKKTSYAFRLIFQSYERTLTDDEVNLTMWHITKELESRNGWEVR